MHPCPSDGFDQGCPIRLWAQAQSATGSPEPIETLVWELDGEVVGKGLEAWIEAPKAGLHTLSVSGKGGRHTARATVAFRTYSEQQEGPPRSAKQSKAQAHKR
jgi:hypothetical protein